MPWLHTGMPALRARAATRHHPVTPAPPEASGWMNDGRARSNARSCAIIALIARPPRPPVQVRPVPSAPSASRTLATTSSKCVR